MFQNIGFTELLLIAIVALVIFGPQKLPEIGRVLGRTIRDFKNGANALLNDEPEETTASKPIASVKPAPQVSTQGEVASSNPVETGAPSARAAVAFVSAAPAVVESADVQDTTVPKGAESGSTAAAEPEAVRADVKPEQTAAAAPSLVSSVGTSSAKSGSSTATAPSASSEAVSAVEAPSVTQTDAAPASPAASAPSVTQTDAAPVSSAASEPSVTQTDAAPASPAASAPSVTQTDAAPASSAAPAPTIKPKAAPTAPPSNTRRLPD